MRGRIAIKRDSFGSLVSFNGSGKELFGCGNIAMLTQQEVNGESLFIDCAVEVSPSPSDSDVSLINAP
jgi:hypothetical protein